MARTAAAILAAAMTAAPAAGVTPMATEMQRAAALNSSLLVGPIEGQPFGFTWGGERSHQLLHRWPSTTRCRPAVKGEATCTRSWAAPTATVKLVVTTFVRHAAVWWHLEFSSGGGSSPILQDLHPAELSFPAPGGPVALQYSAGSSSSPNDFQPFSADLPLSTNGSVGFMLPPELLGGRPGWVCCSGMSSDGSIGHDGVESGGALPFFRLALADGSAVAIGVGWTGAWQANFTRRASGNGSTVHVSAGMTTGTFPGSGVWKGLYARLQPGESIRSPSVAVLFADPPGPQSSAAGAWRPMNLWRRLMSDHFNGDMKPQSGPLAAEPPPPQLPPVVGIALDAGKSRDCCWHLGCILPKSASNDRVDREPKRDADERRHRGVASDEHIPRRSECPVAGVSARTRICCSSKLTGCFAFRSAGWYLTQPNESAPIGSGAPSTSRCLKQKSLTQYFLSSGGRNWFDG